MGLALLVAFLTALFLIACLPRETVLESDEEEEERERRKKK